MKKAAWGLILLLVLTVALVGCSSGVSKDKYNKVKSDLDQVNQKLTENEQILISRDTQLNTANATIADLQAQLDALKSVQQDKLLLQQQLDACISPVCPSAPLREFASAAELESWVAAHVEPAPTTAGDAFRTAVRIQKAALQEGYIISVNAEYDETIKLYRVRCQAFVENSLYHWSPGTIGVFVDYPGGQLLLP